MKTDYRELLKPEILNSVSGLELLAKLILDNSITGLNNSRRVGTGMEFSQYRGYEAGDDLRLLDWKMLARSGRYYIKQSEIETNVTAKFILDISKSMSYEEDKISKIQFSKILIASLAYLAHSQGDSFGLYALNDHQVFKLQPQLKKQFFQRFLQELINLQTDGRWPEGDLANYSFHRRGEKEIIFFISDLYEFNTEISSLLKSLKTPRNEVIVLQIMGEKELFFDYKGQLIFEDMESGKRVKVDAKNAKTSYLKMLEKKQEAYRNEFLSLGIDYKLFNMKDDLPETLRLLLKNRTR